MQPIALVSIPEPVTEASQLGGAKSADGGKSSEGAKSSDGAKASSGAASAFEALLAAAIQIATGQRQAGPVRLPVTCQHETGADSQGDGASPDAESGGETARSGRGANAQPTPPSQPPSVTDAPDAGNDPSASDAVKVETGSPSADTLPSGGAAALMQMNAAIDVEPEGPAADAAGERSGAIADGAVARAPRSGKTSGAAPRARSDEGTRTADGVLPASTPIEQLTLFQAAYAAYAWTAGQSGRQSGTAGSANESPGPTNGRGVATKDSVSVAQPPAADLSVADRTAPTPAIDDGAASGKTVAQAPDASADRADVLSDVRVLELVVGGANGTSPHGTNGNGSRKPAGAAASTESPGAAQGDRAASDRAAQGDRVGKGAESGSAQDKPGDPTDTAPPTVTRHERKPDDAPAPVQSRSKEHADEPSASDSTAKPIAPPSTAAPAHLAAQSASLPATTQVDEPHVAAPARAAAPPPEPPAVRSDRVTVQLPDDAGGARIQVAVRGGSVEARIISADTALASRLEAGLPELEGALGRQGFEDVRVSLPSARSTSEPAAAAWVPTAPGGASDARQRGSSDTDRRSAPEDRSNPYGDRRDDGRPNQRSRRERER